MLHSLLDVLGTKDKQMQVKSNHLLTILLLLISGVTIAETKQSVYQTSPINIDGKMTEWGINPKYFNSESGILYEVRNDESQIYIIIKCNEPSTVKQMQIAGFSLKLTTKTNPPLISYLRHTGRSGSLLRTSQATSIIDKSEMMVRSKSDSITTEGFRYADKVTVEGSLDSTKIGYSKSRPNPETITIEYRIPIKEMYGNGYTLTESKQYPFSLRVVLNDLSQRHSSTLHRPMGSAHTQRNSPMSSNGMGNGMYNNGMRGGSRYPGMSPDLSDENTETEGSYNGQGGLNFIKKSFSTEFSLSSRQ